MARIICKFVFRSVMLVDKVSLDTFFTIKTAINTKSSAQYSTVHGKVNVNQLKVNAFGLTFHWKKLQVKS